MNRSHLEVASGGCGRGISATPIKSVKRPCAVEGRRERGIADRLERTGDTFVYELADISLRKPSLDEVFFNLTRGVNA